MRHILPTNIFYEAQKIIGSLFIALIFANFLFRIAKAQSVLPNACTDYFYVDFDGCAIQDANKFLVSENHNLRNITMACIGAIAQQFFNHLTNPPIYLESTRAHNPESYQLFERQQFRTDTWENESLLDEGYSIHWEYYKENYFHLIRIHLKTLVTDADRFNLLRRTLMGKDTALRRALFEPGYQIFGLKILRKLQDDIISALIGAYQSEKPTDKSIAFFESLFERLYQVLRSKGLHPQCLQEKDQGVFVACERTMSADAVDRARDQALFKKILSVSHGIFNAGYNHAQRILNDPAKKFDARTVVLSLKNQFRSGV